MACWALGLFRGKRSNRVLVTKAMRAFACICERLTSSDASSVMSTGSANSVGRSMMIVGRVWVSSVIVRLRNSGHFLDRAGWEPLQKDSSTISLCRSSRSIIF